MKRLFLCILFVCMFLFCGCSQGIEYSDPYRKMDDYLTQVLGWDDWDLLDYVKDSGLLYPQDLIDYGYIEIDDVMDYIIGFDILSDYGYSKTDSSGDSYYDSAEYEASEYREILQEIAYLIFSQEDGVSKSEIFDQVYEIIDNCTDPMGDIVLD